MKKRETMKEKREELLCREIHEEIRLAKRICRALPPAFPPLTPRTRRDLV